MTTSALQPLYLFPQDEDWSLQTMRLLAQVAVGGADMFECARTAARIDGSTDPQVWEREWRATAEQLAAWARDQAAQGHHHTAGRALFRAGNYWRQSEFFLSTNDPRRATAYREGTRCFQEAAGLIAPTIERIHVPYEGVTLDGYLVRPVGPTRPRPTVLLLGGADSWAEELYFLGGSEFPNRDLNLVVVDTPGRGSSLRFKGLVSRYDYEVPVRAVVDYLCTRPEVDRDRLGVAGISLGGYYAPRVAAMEPRFKALAAWCGTLDVLTDFYEYYAPLQAQLQWLLGASDDADARERLRQFNLRDVVGSINVPVYVMHGTADVIMDVAGARRFVAALTCPDVTFEVFDQEGAMHCSYDHLAYAVARMTDWFADRLAKV